MHAQRNRSLTPTERRTRILSALEDGEFRDTTIAAWAELSDQQTRADLGWLDREGFARRRPHDGRWAIAEKGREYLFGLSDEDKDWF